MRELKLFPFGALLSNFSVACLGIWLIKVLIRHENHEICDLHSQCSGYSFRCHEYDLISCFVEKIKNEQ